MKKVLHFLIYKEDDKGTELIGVCLDLNIVLVNSDPEKLEIELVETAIGYIDAVKKEKLNIELLSQNTPKEYWDKFKGMPFVVQKEFSGVHYKLARDRGTQYLPFVFSIVVDINKVGKVSA
ncbi:MAG: hypothetical protein HY454_02350 [Parcubacteria group bacterium]|nr:hypothetical protein [Parcubacteria group bacterium]